MSEEIAARYAEYSTADLFELTRAGESKLRPEAWQALKNELRRRGLEVTPEDEALASGRPNEIATDAESPESEPLSPFAPSGIGGWLAVFLAQMTLSVVVRTTSALAEFNAQSWMAVVFALHAVVLTMGIVLVFVRDPLAPRFWRAVLVLTACFNVSLGAAHYLEWYVAWLTAAMLIAWATYWGKSLRVRATFSAQSSADAETDAKPVPSVDEINAELNLARRQGNLGVLYVLIGLVVTIGTYSIAALPRGGTYYLEWGAVCFGIIHVAGAAGRRKRARALLQNVNDVVMPDSPGSA